MLVCHCHAVNEHTIRRVVNAGARCGNEVRKACGAGGGCGGCRAAIDRLVELHQAAQNVLEARGEQA